jgi:hypothetical protein
LNSIFSFNKLDAALARFAANSSAVPGKQDKEVDTRESLIATDLPRHSTAFVFKLCFPPALWPLAAVALTRPSVLQDLQGKLLQFEESTQKTILDYE